MLNSIYRSLLITCFVVLCTSCIAFAQVDSSYQSMYGGPQNDYARQIISTSDSGYIIAGTTASFGTGQTDIYVVKTDSSGNKQWSRTYGTVSVEWGYGIKQTLDGGYLICGFTNLNPSQGYDVYVLRIDSIGNLLWWKTYGGTDWDFGYALELTPDGGFIICGKTYSFTNGGTDIYLLKGDSQGNVVWHKHYGGLNDESANAIIRDRDANYVIIGETKSYGAGDNDFYVLKIDGNGDTIWTKTYGTPMFDAGYGIDTTLDGNYFLIGTTYATAGDTSRDMNFIKVDPAGSVLVNNIYGGANGEEGRIVKELPNGEYLVGGMSLSYGNGGKSLYILRYDAAGFFLGGANFGGTLDDEGYSVAISPKNHMTLAGITNSAGCGMNDMYVVRLNTLSLVSNHPPVFHNYCDTPVVVSNIIDIADQPFLISPNPAHDYFTVSSAQEIRGNNCELKITDITGREIESIKINSFPSTIKRNKDLSNGIYLVNICSDGKPLLTTKLVLY